MPISHVCKACGCTVLDREVQAGKAARQGKYYYCAECAALVLAAVDAAPSASVAQARPSRRPGSAGNGLDLSDLPEELPTAHQAPTADPNGFEVVEEFEILAPESPPEEPEAEALEEEEEEESAAPQRASGRKRGSARAGGRGPSRGKMRPAGGARASARGSARASAKGSASTSDRVKKEVFYRSGANRAAANDVNELHDNAVDSSVLKAIKDKKESQRGKRESLRNQRPASRQSKRGEAASGRSQRMSRRGGGKGEGGNQSVLMLAGAGALLVLIGLIFAMSGSGSASRGGQRSNDEDTMPASHYVSRAQTYIKQGNKQAAMDMYIKAAEAAERAGNSSDAERFNQAAYSLQKFTTLKMSH
ncbi:MAG: hypothetical protein M5U26_02030 [Planctomycetota bacterium]|nr:hypothetical protein [Planctomycetota bacterium]